MKIDNPQVKLVIKILLVVGLFFIVYLIVNLLYLRWASYNDIKYALKETATQINEDLVYKNGKWDTSTYVNDDLISQTNPLYIISANGFIIDRESPIIGFLDTSNFDFSSSFQTLSTITTPAGEQWRLYSVPVIKDGLELGTIIVGYYQPEKTALKDIDNQLSIASEMIESLIAINGNKINANNVNSKNISIKISYEIVDRFNHTLQSVGGIPAYIDRSYVANELHKDYQTVTDSSTGEEFLVYVRPMLASNNPVALIATGYSLKQVNSDLRNQFIFSIVSGLIVGIIMLLLLGYLLKNEIARIVQEASKTIKQVLYVSHRGGEFGFDKDTGLLYLYDKKIEIPVKTKQYYICKVLFSRPNKNWENDEVIDRLPPAVLESEALDMYESSIGNDDMKKKARMIYDAIRLLNEKGRKIFGSDIVLIQGKTYRINPSIQPQS